MSDKEELSLQDEIRAAFNSGNAKTDDVDNGEVVDKLDPPKDEKERDEQGRFAKKEEATNEGKTDAETSQAVPETKTEEVAPEPASESGVKLSVDKAPSSWSPKVREQWASLPEEVRSEIIRREEASAHGVRQLHETYTPVKQFAEQLGSYIQEAAQHGQNPGQYIANVMNSERALRNPDVNVRFETLLSIADQYGIPLRQALNNVAGKEIVPPAQQQQMQLPPQIMQELQEMRNWREQQSSTSMEREVSAFSSGKEFFEDVRNDMADLLESGVVSNLAEAYEKACWANPEVREVMLSRQKAGSETDALKQRQAAAAGATVKASGQAEIDAGGTEDDSIEATIRKSIKEVSGRT